MLWSCRRSLCHTTQIFKSIWPGRKKGLITFIITTYTRWKDVGQLPPIKKWPIDKQIRPFDRHSILETHKEANYLVCIFVGLFTRVNRQKKTVWFYHGRKISSDELVSLKPDSSESEFSRLITLAGGGTFSCCCFCCRASNCCWKSFCCSMAWWK